MKLEAPGSFEEITAHQARAEPDGEGVTAPKLVNETFSLFTD